MAKIGKQYKGASKEKAGVKKGKLTDEEKRMQEEMQRLLEEERQRQLEEQRKHKLKERQAEEEKYSRVNRLKINNQWRKLMRLVKVEDLRKEIEIISQSHEREVDRKDAIIQVCAALSCAPDVPCAVIVRANLTCFPRRAVPSSGARPHPARRCSTATWRSRRSSTRWRCARTCRSSTGCSSCTRSAPKRSTSPSRRSSPSSPPSLRPRKARSWARTPRTRRSSSRS